MKAATPKPHSCACNSTHCGEAAQGDEPNRSLKEILKQFHARAFEGGDGDDSNGDVTDDEMRELVDSSDEEESIRGDDDFNGTVDAKCLEIEISGTELLATPSACIRKRTIKIAMDSGAGDHVASPEDVEGFAIEESHNSKAGRNFVAANGGKIRNHGQSMVKMRTGDGQRVASMFQVADVTRPLYSVSKLCDAGYGVSFTKQEGIVSKDGKTIHRFHREGGLYVAEMLIGDDGQDLPFGRQGAKR